MAWLRHLIGFLEILFAIGEEVIDRLGQSINQTIGAFPNLLAIADIWIQFFTGLLGIVLSKSATQYWRLWYQSFEKRSTRQPDSIGDPSGKPWQHVMQPAAAGEFATACCEAGFKAVTLTDDNSLVYVIATGLGRWLWSLVKRFKLLRAVLKLKDVEGAVALVLAIVQKRFARLWLLAFAAALGFLLWLSIAFSGLAALISLYTAPDLWKRFTLFSQHPRKKERSKRIYRRIGGVPP